MAGSGARVFKALPLHLVIASTAGARQSVISPKGEQILVQPAPITVGDGALDVPHPPLSFRLSEAHGEIRFSPRSLTDPRIATLLGMTM